MKQTSSGLKNNVALLMTAGLMSMLALISILNFSQNAIRSEELSRRSSKTFPPPAYRPVSAVEALDPLSNPQNVNENELNDYISSSPTISLNSTFTGKFNDIWDVYKVSIAGSGTLTVRLTGYEGQSMLQLGIYNPQLPYPQSFLAFAATPPYNISTPLSQGDFYITINSSTSSPTNNIYSLINTFTTSPSPSVPPITPSTIPTATRTPTPTPPLPSALMSVSCNGGSTTPSTVVGPGQLITYNATATYTSGWTPKVKYQVLHNGGLTPTPGASLNCGTGTGMPCSFLPSTVVNDNVFITVNLQKTIGTVIYTCDWNGGWSPSVPTGYGSCTNTCERVLPVTANAPTSTPIPR